MAFIKPFEARHRIVTIKIKSIFSLSLGSEWEGLR